MRIIHCADIHLDSSLNTHLTLKQATVRKNEILNTFYRMTVFAKENDIKAVLIAGDLFDEESVTKSTIDLLFSFIKETSSIDYFYVPGNHDEKCYGLLEDKPDNFYVFTKKWQTAKYQDITISSTILHDGMYEELPVLSKDKYNIVMLHGDISNRNDENYIHLDLLRNRNIHYLALGHIHSYMQNKLDYTGVYAYSGCLEGRGFDECGEKGFVLLDTDTKEVSFIHYASRHFNQVEVDISNLASNFEIIQKIKECTVNIPKEDMIEIILTGSKSLQSFLAEDYIQEMIRNDFFYIMIKDETKLDIDENLYKNDISLKGEFIRTILDSNEAETDKEEIIKLGIEALSGDIKI